MKCAIGIPILAMMLAACADEGLISPDTLFVELGEEFPLQFGQTASIRGEALSVEFISVSDSRCPTGVVCLLAGTGQIWEGNGQVGLRVISGAQRTDTSVNTTLDPRRAEFDGFVVELMRLEPYPVEGQPVRSEDYTATLVVVRG